MSVYRLRRWAGIKPELDCFLDIKSDVGLCSNRHNSDGFVSFLNNYFCSESVLWGHGRLNGQ